MPENPQVRKQIVAYCRKGGKCGNPYLHGEVRYYIGEFVPGCPRCGGGLQLEKPMRGDE